MPAGLVILVPGTGGNELFTPPSLFGLGPRIRVWLNYATIVAGGWRWLGLMPDGVTPLVPLTGQLQPGGYLPAYYGTLAARLAALGWHVNTAPCDWRGTPAADAVRLSAQIQSVAEYAPIHLVAHSRGGLVVRLALALLAEAGQLGLVGRVVGLGVPHWGSWDSAGLLAGWDETARALARIVAGVDAVLGTTGLLGSLLSMIDTWPVGYHLLPHPAAPGVSAAQLAAIWDAVAWSRVNPLVSAAWLAAARAAWLAMPPLPSGVPWLSVVGVGLSTADQLLSEGPPASATDLSYTLAGDGTVLQRWAVAAAEPVLTTPTRHNALAYDGRVITEVDAWLRGTRTTGGAIKGRLLE